MIFFESQFVSAHLLSTFSMMSDQFEASGLFQIGAAICPVYTSMPSSCISARVPLLVFLDLFSF